MQEYSDIPTLLSILNLNVIKLTALPSGAKYFIYKKHPIKNIIILSSGTKNSIVDDLVSHFSKYDRDWIIKIQTGEKNKTFNKAVKLVKEFVAYTSDKASLVTNDPSEKIIFKEDNLTYFNLFQNTKYLVKKPIKEKKWDVIENIIWNLCGENSRKYEWVMNWFKCLYNQPDYRFTTSIIFIGIPGTGKGMLTEVFRYIFNNTSYRANSKDLVSKFNSQLFEGKFLLLANEILDQNKKFQFSNDLKEYISEKEISVEGKYMSRYIAKNFVKMIMFSNDKQPIVVEENDRRYFVVQSKKKIDKVLSKQELSDFWQLDKSEFFIDQVEGFCAYLNNSTDYNFDKVTTTPPMTTEKKNIILMNKTDFKHLIEEVMDDPIAHIKKDTHNSSWIKFESLHSLYNGEDYQSYRKRNLTKRKFSAKLNMEGFIVKLKTIEGETCTRVKVPDRIASKINKTKSNNSFEGIID